MSYELLKLENQLCFPVYTTSRLITKEYQPYLDELGITYPQYLVFLVLWEKDGQPVNTIGKKLLLKTNTISPLLKRMEMQGLIMRERSVEDERKVVVFLTNTGKDIKNRATDIPKKIGQVLLDHLEMEDLTSLKKNLDMLILALSKK
jgi:DNA-binding MarR family transcriptional regulator